MVALDWILMTSNEYCRGRLSGSFCQFWQAIVNMSLRATPVEGEDEQLLKTKSNHEKRSKKEKMIQQCEDTHLPPKGWRMTANEMLTTDASVGKSRLRSVSVNT